MALMKPGEMMEEGMEQEVEETPEVEAAEETAVESASIPSSLLGGKPVAPGDVVQLEVVSVDDESGSISVKYAQPKEQPKKLGVEALAAEFD